MWIISNISRSHYTKSCSSVVSILVWDYKLSKFYPKLSIIQDVVTWWEGYTCVQQFPVANLNQLEVLVTNFCHCNKVNVSKMITFCCLPWFWLSISKLGFSWICECESKQQCIEYTHLYYSCFEFSKLKKVGAMIFLLWLFKYNCVVPFPPPNPLNLITIQLRVFNNFWTRYPISFKHMPIQHMLLHSHITTHCSHEGDKLRQITKLGMYIWMQRLGYIVYHSRVDCHHPILSCSLSLSHWQLVLGVKVQE